MPVSLEDLTTDQLLATARQFQSGHELFGALASDPATRTELQRLLKKKNPALVIPELDATEKVMAEVGKRDERIEKLELEILQDRTARRLEAERAAIKNKYHLSDEDVSEVEKMMVDPDVNKRIPSYEAAARVFKAERSSSVPTSISAAPPTFTMPENDVWGKGIGNKAALDKIALTEAYAAWNEVAGARA